MNFENMKSEWDNEPEKELSIPLDITKLKESQLPIDLVKKMMKKELFAQAGAIFFLGLLPLISSPFFLFPNIKLYYLGFFILLVISSLFILKFYNFYNFLNNFSTDTKDNLYEIYYEIKLNLEAYKTWSYTLTPVLAIMITQIIFNKKVTDSLHISLDFSNNVYILAAVILASSIYMYWSTNWWVEKYYGHHLTKIKGILDELKEN
jgi:hypothetical protein